MQCFHCLTSPHITHRLNLTLAPTIAISFVHGVLPCSGASTYLANNLDIGPGGATEQRVLKSLWGGGLPFGAVIGAALLLEAILGAALSLEVELWVALLSMWQLL